MLTSPFFVNNYMLLLIVGLIVCIGIIIYRCRLYFAAERAEELNGPTREEEEMDQADLEDIRQTFGLTLKQDKINKASTPRTNNVSQKKKPKFIGNKKKASIKKSTYSKYGVESMK